MDSLSNFTCMNMHERGNAESRGNQIQVTVLPILKCDSCATDVQQQQKQRGLHVAQAMRILNRLPQYGINTLAINMMMVHTVAYLLYCMISLFWETKE